MQWMLLPSLEEDSMKNSKITTLVVVVALFGLFVFNLFNKPTTVSESNNERVASEQLAPLIKQHTPEDIDKKKQILKQIDEINQQLAETRNQTEIDRLAEQKTKLMSEYQKLEDK